MTHSTRRSYKDKYEELKKRDQTSTKDNVDELSRNLAEFGEFQALAEQRRAQQYDLLQDLARHVTDLVIILDSRDGQLGLSMKDLRKPIDANLCSMDGDLIIRRTRDLVRHASERVGMSGCRISDLQNQVNSLRVGASLLQPTAARARKGYFESYLVGNSPTATEMTEIDLHSSKNPRSQNYEYFTEEDISESEAETDNTTAGAVAVVNKFAKPVGRTAAARRLSQEKSNHYVDIS
jgi:hypothetical protein